MEKSIKFMSKILSEIFENNKNSANVALYDEKVEKEVMTTFGKDVEYFPVPFSFLKWVSDNIKDYKEFLERSSQNLKDAHYTFTTYKNEFVFFGSCLFLNLGWMKLNFMKPKPVPKRLEELWRNLPVPSIYKQYSHNHRHTTWCACKKCLGFDMDELYEISDISKPNERDFEFEFNKTN